MRRFLLDALSVVCLSTLIIGTPPAPAVRAAVSPEELLFMDIPMVITASRRPESRMDSPAAIAVITAEDIRRSGATQLGEALRSVTGLNIRRGTAGAMHIGGIRGMMKIPMNKVMLMVDGRPAAGEIYNAPNFSVPPVALEEIDRIEILKGPGSSLYGSDAMSGVINVITKRPAKTRGTRISLAAGEDSTYLATWMHGASILNKADYRFTVRYDQRDNPGDVPYGPEPAQRVLPMMNAVVDIPLDRGSTLSLFGSYAYARQLSMETSTLGPVDWGDSDWTVAEAKYSSKDSGLSVRSWWQHKNLWSRGYSLGERVINFRTGKARTELQHSWEPFSGNTLVWGGDVTYIYAQGPSIGGERATGQWGLFFNDSQHLAEDIIINGGLRLDAHPGTGRTLSHRLAAVYRFRPEQHLRFTWGSSYRNPTFVENHFTRRTNLGGGLYYDVNGNPGLEAEKAESYELSYLASFPRASFEANAYLMKTKDFIFFFTTETWPAASNPPKRLDFTNGGEAEIRGVELEARVQLTGWLSAMANFTHIHQKEIGSPAQEFLTQTPEHMANAGLQADSQLGWLGDLWVHYVDDSTWRRFDSWEAGGKAKAYATLGGRLAFAFPGKDRGEISVTVTNILNEGHSEYPIDGQTLGRRIVGRVSCRF